MQLQIVAKPPDLCCHLANRNEKELRLLPNYFDLCFCLLHVEKLD